MSTLPCIVICAVLNMPSTDVAEVLRKVEAGMSPAEAINRTGSHDYNDHSDPDDDDSDLISIRNIFGRALELGGDQLSGELDVDSYRRIYLETHVAILRRWEGAVKQTIEYLLSFRGKSPLATQVAKIVNAISLATLDLVAIIEMFGGKHEADYGGKVREFPG